MENDMGWISIHRKILNCIIWDTDEPYSKRDAWIYLLLKANHEDKTIVFDGHREEIKKGQYLTSIRKLAEKWHWGKDKTLKYLKLLEECEMIVRNADSRRTLITIVNYGSYQGEGKKEQTVSRQFADSEQTVRRHSSATNNNDNNVNNDNNENKNTCIFRTSNSNVSNYLDLLDAYEEEYVSYIKYNIDIKESVKTWMKYKDERKPKSSNHYEETGMKSLLKKIHKNCLEYGKETVILAIDDSISNNYQGIVWDYLKRAKNPPKKGGGWDNVKV